MSGFVFKLPRGRRAHCEEDTGDGESFMSFKTKLFSEPVQLSGWRRRYVYITKTVMVRLFFDTTMLRKSRAYRAVQIGI